VRASASRIHLLLCCGLLLGAGATCTRAQDTRPTLQGKVVAYASGSAFAVLDGDAKLRRIKLAGVDAPERRQPFAPQARQFASESLGGGAITIVIDRTDRDNRIYGRVSVAGRDVGAALLEAGLAWCDPADADILPPPTREAYWQACALAKNQRRGLWRDANPVPPWEHRRIPQFDPLPSAERPAQKHCQEIGYNTVQCDDGTSYRSVGSQVIGSDGTTYTRRGQSVTGSDGHRYEQQGSMTYGTDGRVCRTRGRHVDCY